MAKRPRRPSGGLPRTGWFWQSLAIAALLALSLSAAMAPANPASAARPVLDWIGFESRVLNAYAVSRHPTDSARLTAAPAWAGAEPAHRVMLLIPFESRTAYSISVNAILMTFKDRGMAVAAEIWFYDNDLEIAAEAMRWAEEEGVDLIMPVGSDAAEYAHDTYRGGRIPVVTSAAKDPVLRGQMPDYRSGSGTNIAYTSNTVPIRLFASYLRQLLPNLRSVGVLFDETNRSAVETQVEPLHEIADEAGLTVIDVAVRNSGTVEEDLVPGMEAAARAMAEIDPAFGASAWVVSGSTSVYQRIDLINRLGGRAPVIATLPDMVRSGEDSAVVSIGVNQSTAVQLAAHYAVDVLSGIVAVGDLPVGVVMPPDIAVNFRAANRIGLRIPFRFMEAATFIYDYDGRQVRAFGQRVGLAD